MAKKNPVSKIKFTEVSSRIEKGQIEPLYFVHGDEDFLQNELVQVLKKAMFGRNIRDANVERITAKPGRGMDLVNNALEYSLFSGGKLLVVHETQKFNKTDQEYLLKLFPQIPQGNTLIMFESGNIDMRKKYYKYLVNKSMFVSLLPLSHDTAGYWVKKCMKEQDLRIAPDALELFVDFAGLSYSTIHQEVNKIAINFETGATITVDDIRKYGSRSAVFSIFELTEALGLKDRDKALNRLGRLLDSGEPFLNILSPIMRHFNHLIRIHSMNDIAENKIVASRAGVHPFFVKKCRDQIAKYDSDQLLATMRYIHEAEYLSRFEKMPHSYILENLVVKITASPE